MTGARCIAIEDRDGSVGVVYDGGTAEPVLAIVQNDGTTARLALSVQTSRLLQNTLAEVRLEALRAARPVVEPLPAVAPADTGRPVAVAPAGAGRPS